MIRPNYYDRFKCIANECDFTCCQEWKIAVDDDTAKRWKNTPPPQDLASRRKCLEQFTQYRDGQRVISLEKQHCPFLREDKLCKLVIAYGDDILSETCRTFPREIHDFSDRKEATLMPCCPVTIDLLNEEEAFILVDQPSPVDRLTKIRQEMMRLMSDQAYSCQEALKAIFYILHQLKEDPSLECEEAFSYRDEIINLIRHMENDSDQSWGECNEILQDICHNYVKERLYIKFLTEIMPIAESGIGEKANPAFDEEWEKNQGLFHKLLTQEIYADVLNQDSDLSDMIIRMQWIAMEYVTIRQLCRLHFEKEGALSYVQLRNYIVLVSRMMGYEQEDIYEYLENSFEDIIWDWGYSFFILGG